MTRWTNAVLACCVASLSTLTTPSSLAQSSPEDLIPNSVKYRDSGAKPANGRSGSASIEARALVGSDGQAAIELTTGSFESGAAAPGSIDRVQIKRNADSDAAITSNVATAGGFVSIPIDGLVWNEPLQLQANVSGIDPTRTDVVTVTTAVRRRPNLIITAEAPVHAIAGLPYSVNAAIFEVNRDVGARATCVMRVNGSEVDRAENIWVDAGGRVVCHMLHTFESTGAQNVEYALIDQSPADWDSSNNVARTTVHVYGTAQEMTSWNVDTSEETRVTRSTSSGESPTEYEGGEFYESITSQRTGFSALIAGPFDLAAMQTSFYERTDGGVPIYELASPPFSPRFITTGCRFSDRRYAYMTVCTDGALTSVSYFRGSGDVVYISKQWHYWLSNGEWKGFSYVISMPRRTNWSNLYGETLSIEFRISDGVNLWEAATTMPLTTTSSESNTTGCFGHLPTCWTRNVQTSTKSGSASNQ